MDYANVALYSEPRKLFDDSYIFEISEWEFGFLCGLLKEKRPHKIVEVGVAEGASSALIQKCMEMLGIENYEMYSVDANIELYRDNSKLTGFCVEKAQKEGLIQKKYRHNYYGKILPDVIDEIGGDIDFLLLDTMHIHPGELLDTILGIYYMSEHGIICWHDLALDHSGYHFNKAYVNKMCFDLISGKKYYHIFGDQLHRRPFDFANIGACETDSTTKESVLNLISSLSYPWAYLPDDNQLESYRKQYKKILDEHLLNYYDKLVALSKETYKMSICQQINIANDFLNNMDKINSVIQNSEYYIFGTGSLGMTFLSYAKEHGNLPIAFVASDEFVKKDQSIANLPLICLSSVPNNKTFIYASSFNEPKKVLKEKNSNIFDISIGICGDYFSKLNQNFCLSEK